MDKIKHLYAANSLVLNLFNTFLINMLVINVNITEMKGKIRPKDNPVNLYRMALPKRPFLLLSIRLHSLLVNSWIFRLAVHTACKLYV